VMGALTPALSHRSVGEGDQIGAVTEEAA